jgi:spermidine/putrescine transport system permease protein
LLAFTLSFDEVVVTIFLTGRDNTLPMEIWGRLRTNITPEIAAIATLILTVSTVLVLLSQKVQKEG